MNMIDKWHLIRRILAFAITGVFIKVTLGIFDGVILDTYRVTAYGIFCGLETLIIRFYLDSRDKEDKLK
jgi:hypothetical protein